MKFVHVRAADGSKGKDDNSIYRHGSRFCEQAVRRLVKSGKNAMLIDATDKRDELARRLQSFLTKA